MSGTAAIVVALVVALAAPVVSYLAASRKLSGRIDTSEASQLWEEAAKLREEYRTKAATAETRIAQLEERVARLEVMNNGLLTENGTLTTKLGEALRENLDLKAKLDA